MPGKISVLKESGESVNSNVVSVFMVPDTQKKYLISTENAVDPHGLTILHVSEIVGGSLQKVASDEEWSSIKTIMRAIISGNVGSYQYLQPIENAKSADVYSRDISVSATAAKQMSDNYEARDKENTPTVEAAGVQEEVHSLEEIQEVAPGIGMIEETAPAEANNVPAEPVASEAEAQPAAELVAEAPAAEAPVPETPAPSLEAVTEPVPVAEQPVPEPVPVAAEPAPAVAEPAPVAELAPVQAPVAVEPALAAPAVVEATPVVVEPAPAAPAPVAVAAPVVAEPAPVVVEATPVVVEPHMVASSPVTLPISEPAVQSAPEPVTFVAQADLSAAQSIPAIPTAQPATAIPAGQIMQEGTTVPPIGIKYEVNPSFSPDATLDEVVLASQEMFMEGTRNLIQTIQEKIYRDIYHKEAELKAREEMLNQREKMLNDQMMSMMSNFASMQQVAIAAVQKPTKVEVESDKQ